jgi:hypothetical protein
MNFAIVPYTDLEGLTAFMRARRAPFLYLEHKQVNGYPFLSAFEVETPPPGWELLYRGHDEVWAIGSSSTAASISARSPAPTRRILRRGARRTCTTGIEPRRSDLFSYRRDRAIAGCGPPLHCRTVCFVATVVGHRRDCRPQGISVEAVNLMCWNPPPARTS